jgi:hypothetical protein
LTGRGLRRGLVVLATTAAAAASTLCTFLIPPARDTWYTLIHSILNPMTRNVIVDWTPLLHAATGAPGGSVEQKYFFVVIAFFASGVVAVVLTPKGGDAPLVAVAATMLAAAFAAERNIPVAAIAIAPVFANHLRLLMRSPGLHPAPAASARPVPRAGRVAVEILIVAAALGFAHADGALTPGISADGNPVGAVEFMQSHRLQGNVLSEYKWGQYIIWHGAPAIKVFIDSRYDLAYPPTVVSDWFKLANNMPGASHTLTAYPNDFVLLARQSAGVKLMDARPDWTLIYSDNTARLYAPATSPAARLAGVPFVGTAQPAFFP